MSLAHHNDILDKIQYLAIKKLAPIKSLVHEICRIVNKTFVIAAINRKYAQCIFINNHIRITQ